MRNDRGDRLGRLGLDQRRHPGSARPQRPEQRLPVCLTPQASQFM
jgi:hypothetical protein